MRFGRITLPLAAAVMLLPVQYQVRAADGGRWAEQPESTRQWFRDLKRSDGMSCCGEADAVEADEFTPEGDGLRVTVTNGRGYVQDGGTYHVPSAHVIQRRENPTGHTILFLSPTGQPYCLIVGPLI